MFCEKCGKSNYEDAKFCLYCGHEFIPVEDAWPEEGNVVSPSANPAINVDTAQTSAYQRRQTIQKPKRRTKPWAAAVVTILSVAVCVAAAVFVFRYMGVANLIARYVISPQTFTERLQKSDWQYVRTETMPNKGVGLVKTVHTDYGNRFIRTLKFEENGTIIANYTPKDGGSTEKYKNSYQIDYLIYARALVQNDTMGSQIETYRYYIEYTLNLKGELIARKLMINRITNQTDYFGDANIYMLID